MAQRRKLLLWTSKSPCSVWLPFVIRWCMLLRCVSVCAVALERRQWTVLRELLAVKDHLIEIIKPLLIELLHIFVGAQGEHIVLIKNSSASDGEPDLMSPSLDCRWETWNKQSALKPNVCCPLLPAAVNTFGCLMRLEQSLDTQVPAV